MSHDPTLTIAGNNDLASETARHAISSGVGDPVYLWKSIQDPLVGNAPVLVLADAEERSDFARTALEAGRRIVCLPFDTQEGDIDQAIADGRLSFISKLHGLPTMARLAGDSRNQMYGRRYGVYAAHRIPRNASDDARHALADLNVYVCSLVESPLVRLRSTTASMGAKETDAWFLLARFADETIATIEVSAVLPETAASSGELLVEVTGSEAVLRAEPERQSVIVNGNQGYQQEAWYAEAPEFLLQQAIAMFEQSEPEASVSALTMMRNWSWATESAFEVSTS